MLATSFAVTDMPRGIYRKGRSKGTIICIHGYGGAVHPTVQAMTDKLHEKGHSIFLLDIEFDKDFDIMKIMADINSAVKNIDDIEIYLLGGSLGASIAALYASLYPDVVKRLITINGFFGRCPRGRFIKIYLQFRLAALIKKDYRTSWLFLKNNLKPERIKAKTLMIQAGKDKIIPRRHTNEFYNRLKAQKRLSIIPNADHDLTKNEYIDMAIEIITEWLAL